MDKLREFQAKQREKKDELEKIIKKEKFELELKHRNEKATLELKHSSMRAQLKSQLYSEREHRTIESNEKKSLKRKARIENDLYDLELLEQEQEKKKKMCSQSRSALGDVTNSINSQIYSSLTLHKNDEINLEQSNQIEKDVIASYQQQPQQQQESKQLDDSLLNQSIDLNLFDTENIAKTLFGLKKF